MNRVPFHNTSKNPVYIGSEMVPAGETLYVLEGHVPEHLKPRDVLVVAHVTVDIAALLTNTGAEIILALPNVAGEQLADVLKAELAAGDKARTELLEAIGAEIKRRGGEAVAPSQAEVSKEITELAAKPAKDVLEALPMLKDPELKLLEDLEKAKPTPRKTVLEAITAEQLARAKGSED